MEEMEMVDVEAGRELSFMETDQHCSFSQGQEMNDNIFKKALYNPFFTNLVYFVFVES